MTRTLRAALFLTLFLTASGVAQGLSGQVQGTVRDESGRPLPDVVVMVVGSGGLLGQDVTDAAGAFRSDAPLATVRRLSLHHIGYQTAILDRTELDEPDLDVTLALLPVPLPGLVALIVRDVCSEVDDPRARAIWDAARAKYSQETGRRGAAVLAWSGVGYVRSDALGSYSPAWMNEGRTGWAGRDGERRPTGPRLLEAVIDEWGYAWPKRSEFVGGYYAGRMHLNWGYPDFVRQHGYHFAMEEFGRRHTLHWVGGSEAGERIDFCPRDRDRPSMRGRLTIAEDTTFAGVRWAIETGDPFEDAGGEVVFGEAFDGAGERHLVPAQGTFWRHNGRPAPFPDLPRSYSHVVFIAQEWLVCLGGQRPEQTSDDSAGRCRGAP